jgi:hypothetical protein
MERTTQVIQDRAARDSPYQLSLSPEFMDALSCKSEDREMGVRHRGGRKARTGAGGAILKGVFIEFSAPGMTYFGVGSLVLDETGTLYSIGDTAPSNHEYKPCPDCDGDSRLCCHRDANMGEGLDPLLSAGSPTIQSEDLLRRPVSSRNHPDPTISTAIWFSLPRASLMGTVIYEDTALLAGLMIGQEKGIGA